MSDLVAYKLAIVAALLVAAGVAGLSIIGMRYLVWWPTTLFQLGFRPATVWWRLAAMLLFTGAIALLLPPGLDTAALLFFWLLIVPGLTSQWANYSAWKKDKVAVRAEVAALRNEMLERRGKAQRVSADSVWPNYIIDAARLERRKAYLPKG